MRALVHLVGLWLARDIAAGKYPKQFAVPLGFLIARLRTPPLMIAVFGCVLAKLAMDRRGRGARRAPARSR
ncbi:hypothetical protein [Bosea sp. 2RAB26]|uniref:hypothetical protein n=1 Tax=Bosea sp. 2RAB26 TaxID=3237476 RepID=UPI003F9351E8